MYQAVAFDMDDTLLRDDRQISDFTISALRRAASQGVRVIPASGRAKASMAGFVRQLGCVSAFISCNGAEIYSAAGELLHGELLTADDARQCAAFAEENGCYVQCYYGEHFYYNETGHWAQAYAESSLLTGEHVGRLTDFIDRPTPKVLLMAEPETVARLLPLAAQRFSGVAAVSCSKPYFLEMNPVRATKGNALRFLSAQWGVPLSDFAAYGDSLNDLTMLQCAGRGVAMANAREDVKRQVSHVCKSNEEDGVAQDILRWLPKEDAQ